MPTKPTPAQLLAEMVLGSDLASWVADRREPIVRRSWRQIALELTQATNGKVNVTGETLRLWYAEDVAA